MIRKYLILLIIILSITMTGCSYEDVYILNDYKAGVFAYMIDNNDTGYPTYINSSNTYYFINGSFTNYPVKDFVVTSEPSIQYIGIKHQFFKIDWFSSFSDNTPNTKIHIGVKKNGVLLPESIMMNFNNHVNEAYNMGGTVVTDLKFNDTIQIVIMTDNSGNTISTKHFTTTIYPFLPYDNSSIGR